MFIMFVPQRFYVKKTVVKCIRHQISNVDLCVLYAHYDNDIVDSVDF